jgi:predicted Fe-Mo cluster-binding NifX family protein
MENNMRIAFSTDTDQGMESPISGHFGRCPYYVVLDMDGGQVKEINTVPNPYFREHQPGNIPDFIKQQGVHTIISGGMGRRAYGFFQQHGIQVATGAKGKVAAALQDFLDGSLFDGEPTCSGGHHHHGGGECHSSHR